MHGVTCNMGRPEWVALAVAVYKHMAASILWRDRESANKTCTNIEQWRVQHTTFSLLIFDHKFCSFLSIRYLLLVCIFHSRCLMPCYKCILCMLYECSFFSIQVYYIATHAHSVPCTTCNILLCTLVLTTCKAIFC